MTRRYLLVFITVIVFLTAAEPYGEGIAKEGADDESALIQLDNAWGKAEKERDVASLARILDETFVLVDFDGKTYTKAEYLENVHKTTFISYSITDQVARRYGDTGIVVGKWHARWVFDGKEEKGTMQFTAVFSRRHHTWRAVAEAVAKLADE